MSWFEYPITPDPDFDFEQSMADIERYELKRQQARTFIGRTMAGYLKTLAEHRQDRALREFFPPPDLGAGDLY